jgi:hypothetical protein
MKLRGRLVTDPHFGVDAADARPLRLILAALVPVPAWERLHLALVHVEHQPLQRGQRGAGLARRAGWFGRYWGSGKCIGVGR